MKKPGIFLAMQEFFACMCQLWHAFLFFKKNSFEKIVKSKAFTLAELLTATLVISIIMVALAPVITRRAHDNVAITVNQKQGLEIFATPGIYSFDVPIGINTLFLQGSGGGGGGSGATMLSKSFSLTSPATTTWTVPKGVYSMDITITGSGGGGGGSNGVTTGKECKSYDWDYWMSGSSLEAIPEYQIIRGATTGADLCMFTRSIDGRYPNWNGVQNLVLGSADRCDYDKCCWYGGENDKRGYAACTYQGASNMCGYYPNPRSMTNFGSSNPERGTYRLPYEDELRYIVRNLETFYPFLNICGVNSNSYDTTKTCFFPSEYVCGGGTTMGAMNNAASMSAFWGVGSVMSINMLCYDSSAYSRDVSTQGSSALQARCVRELRHVTSYNGAGGASGAQITRTIPVLPDDVLTFTVGAGGNGGGAKTNGSQGGTTQIVHKRGGTTMGTYYVKGGLGGKAATTSAHGSAYANNTGSGQTTPSGTCYIQTRATTSASLSGGAVGCNYISYSGNAGANDRAGDGGRVKNTGTISNGGASSGGHFYNDPNRAVTARSTDNEVKYAKGQAGTTSGFGGGGGMTPSWATSASHFYGGGNGAAGRIDVSYKIALPGSGGGSATRVGGSKEVSGDQKLYEVKYKVQEGSRVVVKIGAGGSGGASGQNGTNGEPTIVGDNKIIFLGGQSGFAVSQTQKNNLSNCIGTNTNSTTIANCINNNSYKAVGGKSGVIGENDALLNPSNGLVVNDSNVGYTVSASTFRGEAGKMGNYSLSEFAIPLKYGFHGGTGGSPFGIRDIAPSVTCGGGMSGSYPASGITAANYVCTSGLINANRSKSHDPVNNEFGGSGGGGGGAVENSSEFGEGSTGSSGYLRIRWNEAEQD